MEHTFLKRVRQPQRNRKKTSSHYIDIEETSSHYINIEETSSHYIDIEENIARGTTDPWVETITGGTF